MGCGCGTSGYDGKSSCSCKSPIRITLLAILFFVIANPETFKLVSGVAGNWVASGGSPSQQGLLLHSLVFALAVYLLVR